MVRWQKTLAHPFVCEGVGLHRGISTQIRVKPTQVDQGRYFIRCDLPNAPRIDATLEQVGKTLLSTELGTSPATVCTVEHLLSALVAFGVDNAEIEIDGPEVPLMDGSAQIWVEQIQRAGLVEQAQSRSSWRLAEPIWVQEQDAFVVGFPAEQIQLSYEINFPDFGPIGRQWYGLELNSERFSQEIAPARTFGLASQVEELRTLGLIKGGTLDNALVCNQNQWLNPPLRFDQEPVRHKLLDLIGDLSLLGQIPKAHILAHKASHKLHVAFAQKIQAKLIPEQLSAS